MSMENIHFEERRGPGVDSGDPGKLNYLHNPQKFRENMKPFVQGVNVDSRSCPGCLFPDAAPGKWPHVNDNRCELVARANSRDELTVEPGERVRLQQVADAFKSKPITTCHCFGDMGHEPKEWVTASFQHRGNCPSSCVCGGAELPLRLRQVIGGPLQCRLWADIQKCRKIGLLPKEVQ